MNEFQEFREATEGKTIEDMANVIRETTGFEIYLQSIEDENKETNRLLQAVTLIEALHNSSLRTLMYSISLDILFAMLDQKFKAELAERKSEDAN